MVMAPTLLFATVVMLLYGLRSVLVNIILFAPGEIFPDFLSSADSFKINFFEKFFQEYDQSLKQFDSRSGPTFSWA